MWKYQERNINIQLWLDFATYSCVHLQIICMALSWEHYYQEKSQNQQNVFQKVIWCRLPTYFSLFPWPYTETHFLSHCPAGMSSPGHDITYTSETPWLSEESFRVFTFKKSACIADTNVTSSSHPLSEVPFWPSLAGFHLLFSPCCGSQSDEVISLLQWWK